ncbi:MAG: hypothetical protein SFV55_02875 [Haliscomenobacter sp.]|uniref:hypothetical protein n=1 Tax=Haliscomenobacter sp. TaxID=2717303 RepID=UPI0029A247C8|nr:hypothetical protein [Haliscomenobacter sp.]MDX2067339.1 hypothetical protein [Haliscomenobacter sp.]
MNCLFRSVLFFLFSVAPFGLWAQQTFGKLTIHLGIKNHRIVIDSATFEDQKLAYPPDTKEVLTKFIQESFDQLDVQMKSNSSSGCLNSGIVDFSELSRTYSQITALDTSGTVAAQLYGADSGDDIAFDFTNYLFEALGKCFWEGSPIIANTDDYDALNYMKLSFPLDIRPPIDLDKMLIVWDQKDTLSRNQTKQILNGLDRKLWFKKAILTKIERHYFLLNNILDYTIGDDLILVLPNKIARVQVSTDRVEQVDQVFYNLLPTKLFRQYLKTPRSNLTIGDSLSSRPKFNFDLMKQGGLALGQLPVFETDIFQWHQLQLNKLSYSLKVEATPSTVFQRQDEQAHLEQYVDVIAEKLADAQAKDSSNIKAAMPTPNEDGVLGAPGQFNPQNGMGHQTPMEPSERKKTGLRRNYLGLGFGYYIQDAFQVNGIFQRLMKNGSTLSAKFGYTFNEQGTVNGGLFVSANYFQDYVLFNTLKKRMSIQLTANSLFSGNRVFEGESYKERRNGGKILSELEWFKNLNGNQLLSRLSFTAQEVSLSRSLDVDKSSTSISYLEFDLIHNYFKNRAQTSTRLMIEPNFKLGWTSADGGKSVDLYTISNLQFRFRQDLAKGFVFSLAGQSEYDSPKTPFFEQFALQNSLNRGFKEDAAIGRFNWTLQPEFWTPVPQLGAKWGKINQFLSQNIRFAVFTDISYIDKIWAGNGDKKATWYSPGVGIRYLKSPTQINLDWAYGFTEPLQMSAKGQFSINLIVNGPL